MHAAAGACEDPQQSCNLVCLPCSLPGRTCCDDGTCLNGLECDPTTMTCTDAPRAAPRAFVIPADYTVTQCLSDGVVVQSPTPDAMVPPIGSFFINTAAAPTDPADICIDCGQFGAVVTAVGEPQPCDSQGAPCVEVQLTTRPALLSEIFTPEALQIGNLTEFSGATLFEATGCGEASSRRLAGVRRLHAVAHMVRDLRMLQMCMPVVVLCARHCASGVL